MQDYGTERSIGSYDNNPPLDLRRQRRVGEAVIQTLLTICGIISILTTVGIVFVLGEEALGFFAMPETSLIEFLAGWTCGSRAPAQPQHISPSLQTNDFNELLKMIAIRAAAILVPAIAFFGRRGGGQQTQCLGLRDDLAFAGEPAAPRLPLREETYQP